MAKEAEVDTAAAAAAVTSASEQAADLVHDDQAKAAPIPESLPEPAATAADDAEASVPSPPPYKDVPIDGVVASGGVSDTEETQKVGEGGDPGQFFRGGKMFLLPSPPDNRALPWLASRVGFRFPLAFNGVWLLSTRNLAGDYKRNERPKCSRVRPTPKQIPYEYVRVDWPTGKHTIQVDGVMYLS